MSALSVAAVQPLLINPSIATENSYSRPDLAARFEDFYGRWRRQREQDQLENEACDRADLAGQRFSFADPECSAWDDLNAECAELVDTISAVRAASLADIILQARACALENNIDWIDASTVENIDPGQRAYRRLVDSIVAMAGIEALPGVSTVPL